MLTSCDAFLNTLPNTEKEQESTSKTLKLGSFINKTVYRVGDALSLTGLRILDNKTGVEVNDYKVFIDDAANSEIKDTYIFEFAGNYHLTIKKDEYEDLVIANYRIAVNADSLGTLQLISAPFQLIYAKGTRLNRSGLTVADQDGTLVDDYILTILGQEISDNYIFENTGTITIKVEKDGYKGTSFEITVVEKLSIILDTSRVKTIYKIGEPFELKGLDIRDDNGQEIENFHCNFDEGEILEEAGEFTVVIAAYGYESAYFNIRVTDQNYLIVDILPTRTMYSPGESFDPSGIRVIDNENNEITGLTYRIGNQIITDTFRFSEEGFFTVEVSKEHYYSTTFEVEVTSKSIYIKSLPNKVEYLVGEAFSDEGLELVRVSDNSVVTSYEISIENGTIFKHDGNVEVTIVVGKSRVGSFVIKVNYSNSLMIRKLPKKLYYELGDRFTLDGIVVQNLANYTKIVDFSSDFAQNSVLNELGKKTITLSKNGFNSTSFDIEVVEKNAVDDTRTISLLTVNDTHGSLYESKEDNEPGLAAIGTYLHESKNKDSLILSAGDMWQGGIESNKTYGLIMTEAMNLIGFDAMAIGNHEFDWGENAIRENAKRMQFPFLGANIIDKYETERVDFLDASAIFDKAGVKIGVIGCGREDLGSSVTQSLVSQFTFPDPIPFIKEESNRLRQEGCDLVVYLSHDEGYDIDVGNYPTKYEEITEISNISGERYVDAMIFAHDHLYKSGTYNGVPFVEASSNSKAVGNITIGVKKQANGSREIINTNAKTHSGNYVAKTPMPEVVALNDKYSDLIGDVNEVVYTFKNSYSKNEFTYIICEAMSWFVNEENDKFEHKPRLSTHNIGGVRNDVSAGAFTYKDFIKVLPFENALVIQKCTENQNNTIKRNSSIRYYEDTSVGKENDGYYYNVSIIFLTDRYTNWQVSCIYHFEYSGQFALYTYLKSGVADL